MAAFGGALLALTAITVLWPRIVSTPFAVLTAWLGAALIVNAIRERLRRPPSKRKRKRARTSSGERAVKLDPPTPQP